MASVLHAGAAPRLKWIDVLRLNDVLTSNKKPCAAMTHAAQGFTFNNLRVIRILHGSVSFRPAVF